MREEPQQPMRDLRRSMDREQDPVVESVAPDHIRRGVRLVRRAAYEDGFKVGLHARRVAWRYLQREIPKHSRAAWLRGFDAGSALREWRQGRGLMVVQPDQSPRRPQVVRA